MGLDGCEIISNSSGSHHELIKLNTRIQMIVQETLKSGGIYLYANQQGCDGNRLYYDGSAMIICNGQIVAYGSQFSLKDVETGDLEAVHRTSKSRAMQSINQPAYERIEVEMSLSKDAKDVDPRISPRCPLEMRYYSIEEEIALVPACWLWDYLPRSKQAWVFLPLSRGIDSCATAMIVHSMCRMVYTDMVERKNPQVLKDLLMIHGKLADSTWLPESPQKICRWSFSYGIPWNEREQLLGHPETSKGSCEVDWRLSPVRPSHSIFKPYYVWSDDQCLYILSITDEML
jgi:NAD+ synthase (glutamine-hydrolysing)